MDFSLPVLLLIVGFILLIKGADFFVEGSSGLAERFGVPPLIIGLTVVAMGTSAPEAAISIAAALKGTADITIGNVVGSNILNILLILGLSALVAPLAVATSTLKIDLPLLVGASLLLLLLGLDGQVSLLDGCILLTLFLLYLTYLVWMARRGEKDTEAEGKHLSLVNSLVGIGLGLILIVGGSNLTVDSATTLAQLFGMSDRLIGLTIVALGTSLPELVTSVTAARRGKADIAIGNIVGSNLFNLLLVVGLSALVIPVPFSDAFRFDFWVSIGASVLLLLCCLYKRKLRRWGGGVLLGGYALYFWFIL